MNASSLSVGELALSVLIRSLPIKHGKHRILDLVCPKSRVERAEPVAIRYQDSTVLVDISDLVGWHFAILKSFDPEVCEVLIKASNPEGADVFWDVGANKCACAFTIAKRLPLARIVAIEPQRGLRAINEANLEEVCPGRYEYFQLGVGTSERELELHVPTDNKGKASLHAGPGSADGQTELVSVKPASSIREMSRFGWPTLVKIDVEGSEPEVIETLIPALESKHCKVIVFENHVQAHEQFLQIRNIAERCGYSLFSITKSFFATRLKPAEAPTKGVTDYVLVSPDLLASDASFGGLISSR